MEKHHDHQPVNNNFGLVALITGIGSYVLGFTGLGWLLAIVAIVFGVMQKPKTSSSRWGFWLGISNLILSVLAIIAIVLFAIFVSANVLSELSIM